MAKRTKGELSKRYGISGRTLRSYELAGVDIQNEEEVRNYQNGQRSQPIPSTPELQALKAKGLELDNARKQKLLDVYDDKYLLRSAVEYRESRIAHVLNAIFRAMSAELPALVAGMDAPAAEKAIQAWREKWVADVEQAQSALWVEARRETLAGLRGELRQAAEAALNDADNL